MEVLRTKVAESGTAVNYETRGIYETGKSDAWKTWHGSPHYGNKGGRNKCGRYTSTHASGEYIIPTAER